MKRPQVYADASFDEKVGIAGLGVFSTLLGSHRKSIETVHSVRAEMRAMSWAIELAEEMLGSEACKIVLFKTDCTSVPTKYKHTQWDVVWVPRKKNSNANKLAREALHLKLSNRELLLAYGYDEDPTRRRPALAVSR